MNVTSFESIDGTVTIDFRFRVCARRDCKHRALEWEEGKAGLMPSYAARWDRVWTPAALAVCRDCRRWVKFLWFEHDADKNERPLTRREVREIVERGNAEAAA